MNYLVSKRKRYSRIIHNNLQRKTLHKRNCKPERNIQVAKKAAANGHFDKKKTLGFGYGGRNNLPARGQNRKRSKSFFPESDATTKSATANLPTLQHLLLPTTCTKQGEKTLKGTFELPKAIRKCK